MTARSLDVSSLPAYSVSSQAPIWWGQLLLTFIEGSMFAALIAMYFYIRLSVDAWPPPGTQPPPVLIPTLALIPLVASAFFSYIATEGAKKNSRSVMIVGVALNLILGIGFLALRGWTWGQLNFTWNADAHGSIVWTILWLHTFDAAADLLFTASLLVILVRGGYDERVNGAVHIDSVVWYFIVLIWLPLYLTIYWGPRVLGTR